MRIIRGKWGGRTWTFPTKLPVRPTTDRTREALFNVLESRLDWEGLSVLELFSGGGSFTLECWSRGAARVVSVDKHPGCVQALKDLLKKWDEPRAEVIRMSAEGFVRQNSEPFDLVFMDPPYDWPLQEQLIRDILSGGSLSIDGLLVAEHRTGVNFSGIPGHEETRKYGSSSISLFYRNPANT